MFSKKRCKEMGTLIINRKTRFEDLPDVLTAQECADYLGLEVHTVRAYIRDGRIRAAKCGRHYRVRRDWVREFLMKASK